MPLQCLRKVFGAHKDSLSYNRMELPLWPHKQKEALWTLHKCLVLLGLMDLEARGEVGRYQGELPVPKSLVFMHSGQTNLTLSRALPQGKPLPPACLLLWHIHTSSPVKSLISTWITGKRRQTFIHTLNQLLRWCSGNQGAKCATWKKYQ